ncbi:LLM class flavin-dependent oxidoreductase [Nocardiopsis sp. CC223A]|uniref:LLM class flavin-dependent oxidoreductase n=1 Tax=Nocardiopsis sp. CC223A TaxID=3044051 RepID=UPI00278BEECD|nr:LLM class flavin-dependent oxidoreductase [Nocardiopsis sp. CC223A]
MGKVSVLLPGMMAASEQAVPFAALVQRSCAERLWSGQSILLDQHQVFGAVAGMGVRVPVGTGVSLMPFRHPLQAALEVRSTALLTGHPMVAGFGPGAVGLQESVLGSRYASPLTAVREFVTIVRGLLNGETVDVEGSYFSMRGRLNPAPGYPGAEVGTGVLRPRMAELAGEVADNAITWLAPPNYIRDALVPALAKGAANADRPAPRTIAVVPFARAKNGRDPYQLAASPHLTMPHYQDMLRKAGISQDPSDPESNARALVDHGSFLWGGVDEIAAGIRAFWEAGVDEVVLNSLSVQATEGTRVVIDDLETILGALDS